MSDVTLDQARRRIRSILSMCSFNNQTNLRSKITLEDTYMSQESGTNDVIHSRREIDTAVSVVGGEIPVTTAEFARRAYAFVMNPQYNPVKEVMDTCPNVGQTPPMLGIFNDIPWHNLREDEVHSWAKAGFTWVVNDGEHGQYEGRYGNAQNAMQLRCGILPIQRLHREAISEHGDAFQKGARATMRPYATTFEEAVQYYKAISFPEEGKATKDDRGGYPVRGGDRRMKFTPSELRAAEVDTQGWMQFETGEYIFDEDLRDKVLDEMVRQGKNKSCLFVGPFDAIMREGASTHMDRAIQNLFLACSKRGILAGLVVGSGSMTDMSQIEDAMVKAINQGARLICVHYMTSDLPYYGASQVTKPFWQAVKRAGF